MFLFFLLLTLFLSTADADESGDITRVWENEIFGVGDYFEFSIDYKFINAGTAVMSIDTVTDVSGFLCYQMISRVSSNKTFDIIFKVRDYIETDIDVKGIFTRKFVKKLNEGHYKDDKVVYYEHEQGKAHLVSKGRYKKSTSIPGCVQDILSALFYVRTLDFNPGDTLSINLHDIDKNYPLKVKVRRRENVEVPAGKFDCIVLEPFLESEGMFKSEGSINLWLTDDKYKIPVLMKTSILIGTIDARLQKYRLGKPYRE
ncbi:DUF3108 domain-containing protein [bacterium]|nr:DUF3108 domain-containing protein [FCB group bacterium]MBL7190576.1 DUF3108 domain-containing protein [bacterium]